MRRDLPRSSLAPPFSFLLASSFTPRLFCLSLASTPIAVPPIILHSSVASFSSIICSTPAIAVTIFSSAEVAAKRTVIGRAAGL